MSKRKISATMVDAMVMAERNAGVLIRLPGGFWTYPGCDCPSGVPRWWVGTPTITSLVARRLMGWAEYKEGRQYKFPIKATLTDAARIILEELSPEPARKPVPA